jgi:nucleoside-diphosphate-sugar epimerase
MEAGVKILVTGATGFLGQALVERLLSRGARDVRCLVRTSSRSAPLEALARRFPEARVELFLGGLDTVGAAARALDGVSLVHHLAATLKGTPDEVVRSTVVMSKNLLEAMLSLRPLPKVVLVSSFGVYGTAELPRGALVDETTPLEPNATERDLYSQAKLRQEKLFWEYQKRLDFRLVVIRPGVIYGPRGTGISNRVGLKMAGAFLALGGKNPLPLTYVDNCAEAIAVAGERAEADGHIYNVVDDDLPTCRSFLRRYRAQVEGIVAIPVPYPVLLGISHLFERGHRLSKGRLPALFTPYKTRTAWGGNRFDNGKIKGLGWRQIVPTAEGMQRAFAWLKENPK